MAIQFFDLARQTAALRPDLERAAARVLESGRFVLGTEVEAFEREFAAAIGARHAVGVASGTDAVEIALRALGVGPGDEVVTQANTCVPTVAAIERAGATPVLCDVEPEAGTMDPESLRGAISRRTRAVVPVHLYGQCADLDAVAAAAGDLPIVEDCAQAHAATFRGRTAGTIGALGAFSFYPTKNLGAVGDGGAVVTDDDRLAERLRLVRQYGQADRYHHVARGVNSRLDELQAALLRVKLPHLATWTARRAQIAARYDDSLRGGPVRPLARLPEREHVFHLYVAVAPDREGFQRELAGRGVATLVHYPQPVHGHQPYAELGRAPVPLTNAEELAAHVVSLPIFPELDDAEVDAVAAALSAVADRATA